MSDNLEFGKFIAERRKQHEYTMRQFADMIAVTAPYFSDIEKGRRSTLTASQSFTWTPPLTTIDSPQMAAFLACRSSKTSPYQSLTMRAAVAMSHFRPRRS